MISISPQLEFFLNIAKAQALIARRFDVKLSLWGIGMNDFIILFQLSRASGEKMRRIDLAEKIGFTASGVTRLLAPMEKIGLVKRETVAHDARVSLVALAPSGKRILTEALENAEYISREWLVNQKVANIKELSSMLAAVGTYTF
ncbi:MAG: MarR family winged helix-turn-helix transcriptional regulator [Candidatus Paceibacterota bacterium]|jgi:DNA-binding MarR family transcriptional regulator